MTYLGKHIILEFHQCATDLLKDPKAIQTIMEAAANTMGATIVNSNFHHFSPLGVSGVVIIMESHLTIHTWPEHNYAAVDIFTCGVLDFKKGIDLLEKRLEAREVEQKSFERGRLK
ncbi:MAG: adenosylmethionine decarboxylase [Saprospiraceae bacterium]